MFDYAQEVIALNDIDDNTIENFNKQILAIFKLKLDWRHVPFMVVQKDEWRMTTIVEIEILDNLNIDLTNAITKFLIEYAAEYWSSLNKEEIIKKYQQKLFNKLIEK